MLASFFSILAFAPLPVDRLCGVIERFDYGQMGGIIMEDNRRRNRRGEWRWRGEEWLEEEGVMMLMRAASRVGVGFRVLLLLLLGEGKSKQ